VSGGIVVTDSETHLKKGIAHPTVRAKYAIVDPELTYGLPAAPTMYAGIDAIAQAIAAVAVTARSPIGNGIAFESIRYGVEALPTAIKNGSDAGARSRMAASSLLGGMCMNIADCGSEHSIAQAIGGKYGLPHGLTIGLVMAETMDIDRTAAPELFERIVYGLQAVGLLHAQVVQAFEHRCFAARRQGEGQCLVEVGHVLQVHRTGAGVQAFPRLRIAAVGEQEAIFGNAGVHPRRPKEARFAIALQGVIVQAGQQDLGAG
jgi:hypothetical protein